MSKDVFTLKKITYVFVFQLKICSMDLNPRNIYILGDASGYGGESKKDSKPFFKTYAVLAIPNIVMQPALDEVQQAVNKAAQMVIGVSKGVSKWSDKRKQQAAQHDKPDMMERRASVASHAPSEGSHAGHKEEEPSVPPHTIQQQPKNYFKAVSENKEVTKLVSLLSTSINSTKKVISKYCTINGI